MTKKIQSDEDIKRKAVKLVVSHMKKKLEELNEEGHILDAWVVEMEELLKKDTFDLHEYHEMRRRLNDAIDCTYDINLRYKLRDSWNSMGKALDKKAKKY